MCPTNAYISEKNIMDDVIFSRVLNLIRSFDIRVINMFGYGEPLLDSKLSSRINQIRQIRPTAYIAISSNGTLFSAEKINDIIESGVDLIQISFDAGSKDIYEKIRINSNFERTIENLRLLSSKRLNQKTSLGAVFVVLKENLYDMGNFVQLFYELGFDFVTFTPHLVPYNKETLVHVPDEKIAYLEFLRLQKEWGNKIKITEAGFQIDQIENDCLRHAASGNIFISCTGDVSPCCYLGHHVPNYKKGLLFAETRKDGFFSLGNLVLQDFREMITSERYINFIEAFRHYYLPEPCRGCRVVSSKMLNKMKKIGNHST